MTGSLDEFVRMLRLVFGPAVTASSQSVSLAVDDCRLRFDVFPGPGRRFGALTLPTMRVEVIVEAGSEAAAAALLVRADLATQRGGG